MKVTVLLPVYNAEQYIAEAIESILNQTFTDFELLVINDGSADKSREIITSYNDNRIRLIDNENNIRLIATLNKGIDLSNGEYIARMDADDVCLPQRLEKQVNFMDANPEVGLCGTFLRTLGLEKNYDVGFATQHDEIKFKLFFDTHFPHPAAMLRKSVLQEAHLRFDAGYIHVEDWKMWLQMSQHCKLAILPEVLMLKRSHNEQVSAKHPEIQDRISREIRRKLIEELGVALNENQLFLYEKFLKGFVPKTKSELEPLLDIIEDLVEKNLEKKIYRSDLFNNFFAEKYWQLCTRSTHLGIWIFKKYRNSIFYKNGLHSSNQNSFLIKSLIRYSYNA